MVRFTGIPADLRSDDLPRIDGGSSTVMIGATADRVGAVIDDRFEAIDVVFPILHGPWGEDGTIQGLLDFVGMPYVGSGVLASAMCMDKITAKVLLRAAGISVAEWVAIDPRADVDAALDRAMAMSAVVFVKPSRAGSSVGITRVDLETAGRDSLAQAVRDAREHDPRVIIEAGVAGAREIECGVRQTPDGAIDTSQVAEISVRDGTTSTTSPPSTSQTVPICSSRPTFLPRYRTACEKRPGGASSNWGAKDWRAWTSSSPTTTSW